MRAVIQRVSQAKVNVNEKCVGEIQEGLLVLLGFSQGDQEAQVTKMIQKILNLRIFPDQNDKMNLSLLDQKASLLLVSQFTLIADTQSGHRPFFGGAEKPDRAKTLFDLSLKEARRSGIRVESGVFGAAMQVSLVNEGPVTLILES